MRYRLCHEHDLARGEKRTFTVKNIPIVLVHAQDGTFYAVYGVCPHQKGFLGDGLLTGVTIATQEGDIHVERDSEILRCPWHGFAFDVRTGRCLADPHRLRIRTYPVVVDHHEVFLDL